MPRPLTCQADVRANVSSRHQNPLVRLLQALAEAAARDADDDWVRVMGAAADGCDTRLHLEPVLERFSLVKLDPDAQDATQLLGGQVWRCMLQGMFGLDLCLFSRYGRHDTHPTSGPGWRCKHPLRLDRTCGAI